MIIIYYICSVLEMTLILLALTAMKTQKQFRDFLNQQDKESRQLAKDSNLKFKPLKRLYGDYIYYQDRDYFDNAYIEYCKKN